MVISNPSSTSTDWPRDALPQRWVQKLFNEMLLAYGKKFTEQWAGADPVDLQLHWARKLCGLTGEELKRGVDRLDTRAWPPTLPEFIALCKPSIDPMVAYYEAVAGVQSRQSGEMGQWSHPAIFWAAMPMAFDLSNQTFSQVKTRWERALGEQMDRGEWAPIPQPMLALPEPGKSALSRENAAKMMQELEATNVTKTYEQQMDHKSWARKIMEREKRGDRDLTVLQVRFAREALGLEAA